MWYVLFFVVSFCFFGGFKGQVRWPKGSPRLALKPSLFVLFLFCFCLFCFSCWVLSVVLFLLLFYLEGFKGQVRWPFGAPHLTLKSSLVVFVVCFWFFWFVFVCVGTNQKKPCFPPPLKKGSFFSFICFLFHFPVHSFFIFLSFFLPFVLSFLLCFVSFFFSCFLSLFVLLSFSLSVSCFPFFAFSSLLFSCILSLFASLSFLCLLVVFLSFFFSFVVS